VTQPLVLGHRGASAYAADNTIEAFELAVADGADGVELDVRFTADGVVIVSHDADIGEMGPLIYHEFATVRRTHPEVPTLDEALSVLGDLIVDVEIKNSPADPDFDPSHEMAGAIARWVEFHDIQERVIVTSFNPETVAAVHRIDPAITTGQLLDQGLSVDRDLAPIAAAGHQWVAPSIADVVRDPNGVIATAHRLGLRVGVWTADDAGDIRTAAAARVDAIICNDPRAALRIVGRGSAV
jgi:glycerophosphoryl diester phosphodiesterase